jgi:hypothetical protein
VNVSLFFSTSSSASWDLDYIALLPKNICSGKNLS